MKIDLHIGLENSELIIVHEEPGSMIFVPRPAGTSIAVVLFEGGSGGGSIVRLTPILEEKPYVETSVEPDPTNRQAFTFTEGDSTVRIEYEKYGPIMRAWWE